MFSFFKNRKKKQKDALPAEAFFMEVQRTSFFEVSAALQGGSFSAVVPLGTELSASPAVMTPNGPRALFDSEITALGANLQEIADDVIGRDGRDIEFEQINTGSEAQCLRMSTRFVFDAIRYVEARGPSDDGVVVLHPEANHIVFAAQNNVQAVTDAVALAVNLYQGSPDYRSLMPLLVADGEVNVWDFSTHPEAATIRAATSITKRQMTLERSHVLGDAAPVGHAWPREAAEGGHFVASWARGTEVVLPLCADRIAFFGVEQTKPTELDFDLAQRLFRAPFAPFRGRTCWNTTLSHVRRQRFPRKSNYISPVAPRRT